MTHVQYIQPIIDVAGSSLSSNFQYLTKTWCKATASLCYACQSMVDLGLYDRCRPKDSYDMERYPMVQYALIWNSLAPSHDQVMKFRGISNFSA